MKIIVINHEYPPVGGGGAFFSRDLAEEWARMGHEIDVVTSRADGLSESDIVNGVNIFRVWAGRRTNFQKASFLSLLLFDISALFLCTKLLFKKNYGFINTHFAVPAGPVGYALQIFFKKKNILFLHGADIYDPSRKMSGHNWKLTKVFGSLAINRSTVGVAATEEIKSKARKYFRVKKDIKIIPLGIRMNKEVLKAQKTYSSKEKLRLITLGRIVARKNVSLMIDVVKILKDRIELTIAGDGPEREYLERYAENKGVREQVRFTGYLSEEKKNRELLQHDIFISTSFHEGFGVVFLEAMQAGLPIITPNVGGQKYFLVEGENALFFNEFKAEEVAEKIKYFFENRDKLGVLGSKNRSSVKNYDINKIAHQFLDLIK